MKREEYQRLYEQSVHAPETFWGEQSKLLSWSKKWKLVYRGDFARGYNEWFIGGQLNASYNCIDRHLQNHPQKTAIIWQGEQDADEKKISYQELYEHVCEIADLIHQIGIRKGDRALIYMPMIPELAYAVLACARLGVVHSVVFAGFSAQAIAHRIDDCTPTIVITANAGVRNGKLLDIKKTVDSAIGLSSLGADQIKQLVFRHSTRSEQELGLDSQRNAMQSDASNSNNSQLDFWFDIEKEKRELRKDFPPVAMDSEDPLFILYTSGSTGKPKGILHTTAGYLVGVSLSFQTVFDHQDNDVYWCTADIGWITGHSYVLYGPLACGATTVMYEGAPQYPDIGRFWQIIEKHEVTLFYTAPTAIRAFMKESLDFVRRHDLTSLRILGTVGEPINPEAWNWYYEMIGGGRCPIADTWWQTETGAIMITNLQRTFPLKPGSAGMPFFGIQPVIVDQSGKIHGLGETKNLWHRIKSSVHTFFLSGKEKTDSLAQSTGALCIQKPWPSMTRNIHGDEERFYKLYLAPYPGYYFSGDRATLDQDGYFWINGRMDDVLNVSGHRLGSAEIESAIICHSAVSESAVVGFSHPIKGEGIYAFVTLKTGIAATNFIADQVGLTVVEQIGKIARPDYIQWAPSLPKTRSGKIMRRILRKIANNDWEQLGDLSTLAEQATVRSLITDYKGKVSLGS